jgi:hypothetical protein
MKKALRIDGFAVEIFPTVRRGCTSWTAWLQEYPSARAEAGGYDEALKALAARWDEIKAAHRTAGQPIPTPARRRGNKRILDTIRRLGERKTSPIF